MTDEQYIQTIVGDVEDYLRAFGLADNFLHRQGNIEWIEPLPGYAGPHFVFKVSFSDKTADEIEGLMSGLQEGTVPALWVLSPISDPALFDVLRSKGFEGSLSGSGEFGMAMDLSALSDSSLPSDRVEVKKVASPADFRVWMDVVNAALHGWNLLTMEHFSVWLDRGEFAFYLGCLDGVPVSTAAAFVRGRSAGIEFVSTLEQYLRRGAGYAVCHRALLDLLANGVEIATLCSLPEADKLYEKLGFRPYYEQVFFQYKRK